MLKKTAITNTAPNFLVIGAPKSGTTSLYFYLRQHPDIFLPDRKELHYFSYSNLKTRQKGPGDKYVVANCCKNFEEYLRHFRTVRTETAIGDCSPSYLFFPEAADKIYTTLGNVKIIVILRNPIEKAYSQYIHLVSECREQLSFEDALKSEHWRKLNNWSDFWLYKESSLYCDNLERYIDVFGKNSVKVLLLDDLKRSPTLVLKELFQFLHVDTDFKCQIETIYNNSGVPKSKLIANYFIKPNPLLQFAKCLIPSSIGAPLRRFIIGMNRGHKPDMNPHVRHELSEYFAADIARLEHLLNRKLDWK